MIFERKRKKKRKVELKKRKRKRKKKRGEEAGTEPRRRRREKGRSSGERRRIRPLSCHHGNRISSSTTIDPLQALIGLKIEYKITKQNRSKI